MMMCISLSVKPRFIFSEVEKELGKKGKKATFGSIQQAPELPTKTRTLRKNMDNRDGDSPGKTITIALAKQHEEC